MDKYLGISDSKVGRYSNSQKTNSRCWTEAEKDLISAPFPQFVGLLNSKTLFAVAVR